MNALQRAKASIHTLHALLSKTADVREAANLRRTFTAPQATQLIVSGNALVRVVDADTGACLGFRQTIREARWLQQSLERGEGQVSSTEGTQAIDRLNVHHIRREAQADLEG